MSIFIVIGMARSGTSFLTGWLNEIGISMGRIFLQPDEIMNEKGFYEDLSFSNIQRSVNDFNEDLNIDDLRACPEYKLRFNQEQFTSAMNLLQERDQDNHDWGWKITAETYRVLSSFWIPALNACDRLSKANFVVAFRHYNKSVGSLMRVKYLKRKKESPLSGWKFKWLSINRSKNANFFLKEWIEANREILQYRKDNPSANIIFTNTDYLLAKNTKIFEAINAQSTRPLEYISPKDLYDTKLMDRPIDLRFHLDANLKEEADAIYNQLVELMNTQKQLK
ncbi:MAG: hypothetical protein DI598_13125 [Pseudopedobacter saltans]|uniref:Sulfotransferase family protein n=1 Tax=Pseudopedobacter saltans TaxID=151895 RepID=A0A2W5ESU0_9SPHI|nr:MAG: hypothetical protein DI598_13125 [Pseudopedobacter saltans]